MRDISFGVVPIRDHAFFEQAVPEREVGDRLLQRTHLIAQVLDVARGGLARRVARKPAFVSCQKPLRSAVAGLSPSAQFGDRRLAEQPGKDDPDLLLC